MKITNDEIMAIEYFNFFDSFTFVIKNIMIMPTKRFSQAALEKDNKTPIKRVINIEKSLRVIFFIILLK